MAIKNTPLLAPADRDSDILEFLRFSPFTAEELLALSRTLREPFTSVNYLQKRLRRWGSPGKKPQKSDLVRWWAYATDDRTLLYYYKLTRLGFRTLFPGVTLPSRSFFDPVSLGSQKHTQPIAAFLAHTIPAAHRAGVTFTDYQPENHHSIEVDGECHLSDGRFTLEIGGKQFFYSLEVDNGTERYRSKQDTDSLERMSRMYEHHIDRSTCPRRERVLFLANRSLGRVTQFLTVAEEQRLHASRTVFYAAYLPHYLANPDPIFNLSFTGIGGDRFSLLSPRLLSHGQPDVHVPPLPIGRPTLQMCAV